MWLTDRQIPCFKVREGQKLNYYLYVNKVITRTESVHTAMGFCAAHTLESNRKSKNVRFGATATCQTSLVSPQHWSCKFYKYRLQFGKKNKTKQIKWRDSFSAHLENCSLIPKTPRLVRCLFILTCRLHSLTLQMFTSANHEGVLRLLCTQHIFTIPEEPLAIFYTPVSTRSH